MQLEDYLTIYINSKKNENLSEKSLNMYQKELVYFFDFLQTKGVADILDIQPIHIELYQSHLINELKNKPNTRGKKVAIQRTFFKYLVNRDFLEKSPARALSPVKIKEADMKKREALTIKEAEKLINKVEQNSIPMMRIRNKCIFMVFIFCGLRVSELVNLKVEHLDFKSKTLYVFDGKGGKNREVPLFDEMIKELKEHLKTRPVASEYLFTSKKTGTPLSTRTTLNLVKRHAGKAGITKVVGCHTLRRTNATIAHSSGIDIVDIQLQLGHSDPSTTARYIRRDVEEMKEKMRSQNLLAKKLKKQSKKNK